MSIVVKHSGNVAPTAVGAYGGGQGKRYEEDGDEALARIERRREVDTGRSFQASEAEATRIFQTEQGDLANERWRENVEFGYTAKQRAEHDQLSNSYEEARKSGDFTPDELQEVKRRVLAKQQGIEPLPSLPVKSKWKPGQAVGEIWDEGGIKMSRDKDNIPFKLGESDSAAMKSKDLVSVFKDANAAAMDPNTNMVDPAKVQRYVDSFLETQKRVSAPPPPPVPVATAAPAPGAAAASVAYDEPKVKAELTRRQAKGYTISNFEIERAKKMFPLSAKVQVLPQVPQGVPTTSKKPHGRLGGQGNTTPVAKAHPVIDDLRKMKGPAMEARVKAAAAAAGISEESAYQIIQQEMGI